MTKMMKHSGQSGSVRKIGKKMALLLGITLAALLSFSCKQDDALTVNNDNDNTPKTFDIVYVDGGNNNADNPAKYSTDKLPVELKAPAKTGFDFKGWYKDKDFKNKVEKIEKGTTGKLTFYAKWSEISIPSASYKVIHLRQPITGDTYAAHETEPLSGKVGAKTTAAAKNYTGFHLSKELHKDGKILQEKIEAGDKTVVNIYYDRDIFTAKFNTDGGNEIADISGRYEAEILPPTKPIKAGFTFIDWEPKLPAKFTANTTHKATWTAEVLPEYKVEHWQQKLDGNGKACDASHKDDTCYELKDTDTQNGKKGEQTKAKAKDYPGFTSTQFEQQNINEDGSTVVKIYYVRKAVTLTFDAKGGKIGGEDKKSLSGKYGEKIESNEVPNPLRNADEFSEWKPAYPTDFPAENRTYEAQWKTLNAIEIEMLATPIEYFKGADFNPANIKVKAKYSDGSNPLLSYNSGYKTDFDTIKNNVGNDQTVTVWHAKDTAKTITKTFKVNIKAPVPTYSAGDVIDTINNKKIKAADFTMLAAGAQWEKYYVIIKQEGTKYIAVRYLDNSGWGEPETGNSPSNTYRTPAKPAFPDRYLKPEDITSIVTNKVAVKASMDKIKTISGLSEYTNENCIASEDNGYSFTNGNGTSLSTWAQGPFIPFAAREFN